MELNIQVTVHTPADVLRYARSGAIPMDTAARTCLEMAKWNEDEIDAVLSGRKKKASSAKKTGRPSGYEARKDEVVALLDNGTSVAAVATALKVSLPTARAWITRAVAESSPDFEVQQAAEAMLRASDHELGDEAGAA
jgi:DNA-binding NarL/FixJ family response regulator